MINCVFGGFSSFKQTTLKKIFAHSSLYTLGLTLALLTINSPFWVALFLAYGARFLLILKNLAVLEERIFSKQKAFPKFSVKTTICLFLNTIGFPPFPYFFFKITALSILLVHSWAVALTVLFTSVFLVFAYLTPIFYYTLNLSRVKL